MIELLIHDLENADTEQEARAAYNAICRILQDEDSRVWYEQMLTQRVNLINERSRINSLHS